MSTIKIASKFLTKSEANKQASKERQLLKAQGQDTTHMVEVLFAYNFWRTNKWFSQKKFGLKNPTDQDYIVVITEVKKLNTTNMPKQKKQMQTNPSRNISQSNLEKKLPKKNGVAKPRTNRQPNLSRLLFGRRSNVVKSYTMLTIPIPTYYRSVA